MDVFFEKWKVCGKFEKLKGYMVKNNVMGIYGEKTVNIFVANQRWTIENHRQPIIFNFSNKRFPEFP